MPVCLCLCTFIEIRKGTKNLDLVLCTVVYIGLGKTSVTIWTISSLENWGNHWGKWTILRSFRTTWVTLHDCIGGVTWQHISCDSHKSQLWYEVGNWWQNKMSAMLRGKFLQVRKCFTSLIFWIFWIIWKTFEWSQEYPDGMKYEVATLERQCDFKICLFLTLALPIISINGADMGVYWNVPSLWVFIRNVPSVNVVSASVSCSNSNVYL